MRRRLASAGLALAAVISLAGCTPEATPLVTDLTWVDGASDAALESDPAVAAVRQYETIAGSAWNVGDFSGTQVAAAMDSATAEHLADQLREAITDGDARPVVGPRPFTAVEVSETDDADEMLVVACVDRILAGDDSRAAFTSGRHYRVRTDREVPYVVDVGTQSTADCEGVVPPIALYDPAPDDAAFAALRADDVGGP